MRQDVQWHVHLLEDVLIATCAYLGVEAARRLDAIGVWVGAEKIASIGVGVRRGVTYHGVALNVACDLTYFGHVVPCRESALRFTSLARLLATAPTVETTAVIFRDCFAAVFGYTDVATVGV
jgi:lipoate-protein ligase B